MSTEVGLDPFHRFLDEDDVCSNKHGGVDTSRAAFRRARYGIARSQLAVLECLRAAGSHGLTCKEISQILDRPMHKISGRLTELMEMNKAKKLKATRNGGHIIVLADSELPLRHDLQPGEANPPQKLSSSERKRIEDSIQNLSMKETLDLLLRENLRVSVSGWETIV